MDTTLMDWLAALFRWAHVVTGILWIGMLYFFNWVNGAFMASLEGETKRTATLQLMPRALFWFRWGAAYTWITGIILLVTVVHMGGVLVSDTTLLSPAAANAMSFGVIILSWPIYDFLWKSSIKKSPLLGALVSLVLVMALAWGLDHYFSGRAMYIHIGIVLGTLMAANVWMRIWPNQKRILAALREGRTPDASWAALAGLRSKHNTYMSMPLIFTMVSNHFPTIYGDMDNNWWILGCIILLAWLVVFSLYKKAAQVKAG